MTTEIYKYQGDKLLGYNTVEPGDYKTILNVNSAGDDEIIVVYCRQDNKCSLVYTIHPRTILFEATPQEALYDKKDTENRALVIKPGAEEIIRTREKTRGSKRLVSMRYRLAHR